MNRLPARNTILVALGLALAAPAARADDDDHVEARRLLQQGEILPLTHILQVVQRRAPGDVNAHTGEIRKIEDD